MAGPGGGPPRKSHTKSRKGCKTCKKRHIRCDESFPQCKNCTKHNCRCDYMDNPPPTDDVPKLPPAPNPLWDPHMEAEVDNWIRTGIYPFPELALSYTIQFTNLSKIDRCLIHHLSTIYRDLSHRGLLNGTAWVDHLPIFLDLTYGHEFVMSAILAFGATSLAGEMKSVEIRALALHYRGSALAGVSNAIGNFSDANSDAILAASILLSWQAADWSGWTRLMQGITTVMTSMTAWKDMSLLARFVERHIQPPDREPLFLPPGMGGMMAPILPEDDHSILESIDGLQKLIPYIRNDELLFSFIKEILTNAQEIEACSRTMRPEQLFEKLQPLRIRLLLSPIHLIKTIEHADATFLTMAHLYGVAMAIDAALPELMGAAFGALVAAPFGEIDRRLGFNSPPSYDLMPTVDDLMMAPRQIASRMRQARGSLDSLAGPESINPGQGSPYSFHGLSLDSGPTTPAFPPTFPGFMSNLSNEELNLSVPPSPFLSSWVSPGSRPHSGLFERSTSRPTSINFDRRSFSGFSDIGAGGDSPSYSPGGHSPVPSTYLDQDAHQYTDHTGSWGHSPGFPYDESADKNKGRALSWQGTPPNM